MVSQITPTQSTQMVRTVPLPLDQNPAIVYLASLTGESGRRTQQQILRKIAEYLGGDIETIDWAQLRYQHTAALRTKIAEDGYAPASVRKFFAAIRGVLLHAWRLQQMTAEDYQRAIDLGKVRGASLPAGRYIRPEEIEALMKVCMADPSIAGVRDAAIIGTLYFGLLRREEVVEIKLEDFTVADGTIKVTQKGQKDNIVCLANGAADAMADWLAIRGQDPGPIFLAINKSGKIRLGSSLTAQSIYNMLIKRSKEAGLEDISPHDFRRTGISDLLDKGVDLVQVQKMANHANPQTTSRYDRRPETRKREAAAKLDIPYKRREGGNL